MEENIQKRIFQNKINKGFNITDVPKEFCAMMEEMGEAYSAYRKKKDDLGEELADVAIFLFSIAEITGYDLLDEISKKMAINEKRQYKNIDGVLYKVES